MASQDLASQENLRVFFVVLDKYESEDNCNEFMWDAYNACVQNEFQPQWIYEKECHSMEPKKSDVFVVEEFEGEIFEKLQTFKCFRIVGPRCLLSCFLSGEPIPEGVHPVFTTAMRGMIVSATGFEPHIKDNIAKKVQYMGGIYIKQLRSCVTHLISNSAWSAKYEKAVGLKIPVLRDGWVDAIWEANLRDFVKADDPQFEKYRCPVFMNIVVTSTNVPKRQKEEVKKLIEQHGGTFMGMLDGTKVKIVLAPERCPLSDKLKYAKQNNIACLNVNWVYDSVKTGYALPFNDYLITSTKSCSTPEKSQAPNETLNFSTISAIPADTRHINNFVDESMSTTTMSNVTNDISAMDRRSAPQSSVLDRLDVREAKLAGPFLDGCNIYLAGFTTSHRDKINRILNAGSATRLDDISDAVTHVIVGDASKAASELKIMKSRGLNPYILSLDWLEESIKLKRAAPEENFIDDKKQPQPQQPVEPPSPLSKKNIQMLQKPRKPPIPQFDKDKEISSAKADEWNEGEEEANLMKQYLQKTTGDNNAAERSFQEFLQPHNRTPERATSRHTSDTGGSFEVANSILPAKSVKECADDSAVPMSQPTLSFNGLTFLVTGFDMENSEILVNSIAALGGRVVTNSFAGVPDFGVVPVTGASLKHAVDEIITDLYIDDCVENQRVVELKHYHRPLAISLDIKPLANCVIGTSMYTGTERAYLIQIAKALGAEYQDTFARKSNEAKRLIGSTHLLCPTPEGSKYNAAIKWKLPAVTADWLIACATKMRLVNEVPYLVGEAIAPERPEDPADLSSMAPPTVPTPRNIRTPKRHLQQRVQAEETPGYDTPLINKRLSTVLSNTPPSPFQAATPDTPYGQFLKPNPSPATRKTWTKWIDNFPDMKVEEPPLKRRAPSTPFSELRRRFWSDVNKPTVIDDEVFNAASPVVARASPRVSSNNSANFNTSMERAKETSPEPGAPINRKLSFKEDSPAPKQHIDLKIEQLDQVLQATSSTTENRYSLSGNAKIYNQEEIEPIDKRLVKDSQPDTVGWEDPAHGGHYKPAEAPVTEEADEEEEPEVEMPRKRKFMLSGIKDRSNYETAIINLGGELSTGVAFDPTATHLLCIRPSRNEKMLGSIAAGKWVLHCSYLKHCEDEGKFIDEERFEWGNPLSKDNIPEPSGETERSIAGAVYRWRLRLSDMPGGAFHDMTAMLLVQKDKYEQFERFIKAGDGVVVQAKPPYDTSPNGRKITHCFVQPKFVEQPIEWAMFANKGILCFQPQYLSEYLTAETPTNPRDSVIAEFKMYLKLLPK